MKPNSTNMMRDKCPWYIWKTVSHIFLYFIFPNVSVFCKAFSILFKIQWIFQGIMPRVYETFVVLFLLTILVCGLAWVASALIDNDQASRQYLFGE